MDTDSEGLFECVKLFAPNFHRFVLDHFVYFAGINMGWTEEKVMFFVDVLVTHNKITIENNLITIN